MPEFKNTEIGEIPSDWEFKRLGEDVELSRGISWGKADESADGVPVIGIPNVQQNNIDYEIKYRINKRISDEKRLKDGDILLVGASGSVKNVGRSAQVSKPPSENITFASFLVKAAPKSNNIENDYLRFVLQGPTVNFVECSRKAADGKFNLQIEELKKQPLLLPPKPEQKKIADTLSKIQRMMARQEKTVEALREVKAGTIAKLFSDGITSEPTKQTDAGEIPKSWDLKKLNEVCEKPQYGYTESSSPNPIGPKFLRITDITEDGVNWGTVPYCKCSDADFEKYSLNKGDILVARIGATTGKNYLIQDCPNAVFASYLIRMRTLKGLLPEFLSVFMESEMYWRQVGATKGQNLKGGMSGAILSQIVIPMPKEDIQSKISKVIVLLNKQIAAARAKEVHLSALFSSTLNQLMTGRVRLLD